MAKPYSNVAFVEDVDADGNGFVYGIIDDEIVYKIHADGVAKYYDGVVEQLPAPVAKLIWDTWVERRDAKAATK